MVRRALAADPDVFPGPAAGGDGEVQEGLDGTVALVEAAGDEFNRYYEAPFNPIFFALFTLSL